MNILTDIPEEKLTTVQENDLALKHDNDSLATLVLCNLREAFFYARGCDRGHDLDDGEILSSCYAALEKASKKFKPNLIRFLGYAKPYIRGELSSVRKSRKVVKGSFEETGIKPKLTCNRDPEDSYKPAHKAEGTDGWPVTPTELPAIQIRDEWAQIEPIVRNVLDSKERMILELHYKGDLNFRMIGELLGQSRSDAHRTHQVALRKIRNALMETRNRIRE